MTHPFRLSNRLEAMPPYIFSELNTAQAKILKEGRPLLSLGIGDPDRPTPASIIAKMKEASEKPANHQYSDYEGSAQFRKAVQSWYARRYKVDLDADKEIIALIGSKEGVAHFPLAYCNMGDKCLFPSPGYPAYSTAVILAGGIPIPVPHFSDNGFLPDPNQLERLFLLHRPKYMVLNYPSNPTTALCAKHTLSEIVFLAKKHNVILGYDNAYSEIYFNPDKRPISILEIPGAKDIAVEFNSLSKMFNMTGWRIGMAVGNPDLIQALLKIKTNVDSGPILAVQEAAAYALDNGEDLMPPIRETYAQRRDVMLAGLDRLQIEYFKPEATFFVWARVPKDKSSMGFAKRLIEEEALVVTPGIGFGKEGEYFFRMSLTADIPALEEALNRLDRFLKKSD